MRFMMKVTIPVDRGNKSAADGNLGKTIQSILEELKPEAAYFADVDGCRGGYIFFHMEDASKIPSVAEPWFLAFDAEVEISAVMVPEDLAAASQSISDAVEKYS